MLNCSTCHRGKPESHFYRNPTHRPHLPASPTPEDADALARLLADGRISATTARTTPTASRATLAQARERLATGGRPVESEAQRARREAAQLAAAQAEEDAARQAEEDAAFNRRFIWGAGGLIAAFVGLVAWGAWRGGASA